MIKYIFISILIITSTNCYAQQNKIQDLQKIDALTLFQKQKSFNNKYKLKTLALDTSMLIYKNEFDVKRKIKIDSLDFGNVIVLNLDNMPCYVPNIKHVTQVPTKIDIGKSKMPNPFIDNF
jgi:hypothetical protein